MAVNTIVVERQKNGGKIPRGLIPDLLDTLQGQGIVVSRDVLNGRYRRCLLSNASTTPPVGVVEITESTTVSSLSENDDSVMNAESVHCDGTTHTRGRPQGSTNKAKQMLCTKRSQLLNEVALEYAAKLREKKWPKITATQGVSRQDSG